MGGRRFTLTLFAILTVISMLLSWRAGEGNFVGLYKHTGPYGVGIKVFWTKDMQNHTLVYYPTSYFQWYEGTLYPASRFMPWNLFGKRG